MNYKDLLEHRNLIDKESDHFAVTYSTLAGKISNEADLNEYLNILESDTLHYSELSEEDMYDIRFGAFYVLCILYRRRKEYAKLSSFVSKYREEFSEEVLYTFQKAVSLKSGFPNVRSLRFALLAFDEIRNAHHALDSMPFFIQAYTDTVAKYYDELNKDMLDENDRNTVLESIELLINAIAIRSDYAKYYSTIAKLYRLAGNFESAKENIRKAIELEDSNSSDYAIRVNEYEILNSKIDLERLINREMDNLNRMSADFDSMKESIDKSKTDSLAFLGFFTGIISFILGTFQLGNGLNFAERIQVMAALLSCLLIAFSVFRLIIAKSKKRDLLVCLIAVLASLGLMLISFLVF